MAPLRLLVVAALFFATACADGQVTAADWQAMNGAEKTLYVNSLLGAEKVRERKGGREHGVEARAEEIVRMIDAAYARADARSPEEIFSTLAPPPDSQPQPPPASL